MKNLDSVHNFYQNVELMNDFNFQDVADLFSDHDIFADPPRLYEVTLPFLGEIELGLAAIRGNHTWLRDVAVDDGEYRYKSEVVFFARQNEVLAAAGYTPDSHNGPFAGMVKLSGHQSYHGNLFGHPTTYSKMSPDRSITWGTRRVEEFCTDTLPRLIKNAIPRFYPRELHIFPFDDQDSVEVMAKDTTKIGGHTVYCNAKEAFDVYRSLSDSLYTENRGNVHICGHIRHGNILFVIPAFGKNHVAFAG